jgi:hypothetical protein
MIKEKTNKRKKEIKENKRIIKDKKGNKGKV